MQSTQETNPITMQARLQDSVTGGHKQIGAGHKKFTASNSREWTKKQRSLSRISTNSGVKAKKKQKKNVFISKNTQISTISGVKPQKKRTFNAKSAKKQFLLTNSWMATSILGVSGLDLHSSGTKPLFVAKSSLGVEQFSFGGAQAVIWEAPPWNSRRATQPVTM